LHPIANFKTEFLLLIFVSLINNTFRLTLLIGVTSGFRREVDENCALLGYYPADVSGKPIGSHLQGSRIQRKPGTLVRGLYKEECFLLSDVATTVPFSSAAL
jgi:hypothetical protein